MLGWFGRHIAFLLQSSPERYAHHRVRACKVRWLGPLAPHLRRD